jgi:hypothetical protein
MTRQAISPRLAIRILLNMADGPMRAGRLLWRLRSSTLSARADQCRFPHGWSEIAKFQLCVTGAFWDVREIRKKAAGGKLGARNKNCEKRAAPLPGRRAATFNW